MFLSTVTTKGEMYYVRFRIPFLSVCVCVYLWCGLRLATKNEKLIFICGANCLNKRAAVFFFLTTTTYDHTHRIPAYSAYTHT